MNYELAKKLKDAGFPQKPKSEFPLFICEDNKEPLQVPTLSELIEACGEGFKALIDEGESFEINPDYSKGKMIHKRWMAGIPYGFDDGSAFITDDKKYGDGNSPEEAVANLWLELNKKS